MLLKPNLAAKYKVPLVPRLPDSMQVNEEGLALVTATQEAPLEAVPVKSHGRPVYVPRSLEQLFD